MQTGLERSLDEQIVEFRKRRFIAMPIAGLIMWTLIGVAGALLSPALAMWALWIGAGFTFYLGVFISKFTGEEFFNKDRPKNTFDRLFFLTIVMSCLVFAIAMPFANKDYTSAPMTVGILAGLMWVPFSWLLDHWIGIFHGVARTVLIVVVWYAFPDHRFVAVPCVVVLMYLVTLPVLELRYRKVNAAHGDLESNRN